MAVEIIECEEFAEVPVRIEALIGSGELKFDERTIGRGYFNVTLRGGQVVFRADRYVGLIPVTETFAIRVKPRASIASLSFMLAKSGVAPVAIPSFSRGYLPRFQVSDDLEKTYCESLLQGIERVIQRGVMKGYVAVAKPPSWRGRLLIGRTVQKHISRGVRYRHEFAYNVLSKGIVENVALRESLMLLKRRVRKNGVAGIDRTRIDGLLGQLGGVPDWHEGRAALVSALGRRIAVLAPQVGYYRDPLWVAFLLLQSSLPDMDGDGAVALDSLVVDASKVFEAYVRRVLFDRAPAHGWNVRDGNLKPSNFFVEHGDYTVRPDIVIAQGNTPIAVLDAKYKLKPKDGDRYELLAFMDALGVQHGGFVCPQHEESRSTFLGTTIGSKRMSSLRFDLAASDPVAEADRLFTNVKRLVEGNTQYI